MTTQYADISSFQGAVDWSAYSAWSDLVAIKATEGVGYTDPEYTSYRTGAINAGLSIIYYHFARPDLGNSAVDEANWLHSVVGQIREQDMIMLDCEVNASGIAAWALAWLAQIKSLYGFAPTIYASTSYIQAHLQDSALAAYPLTLANWTYDASARPACPLPWFSYKYLQYSDRGTVPGISGAVDVDVFLAGDEAVQLNNFPIVSQRDSNANADFDCVPASIAACLEYLTGKIYTASMIKNAVYGSSYVGPTDPTRYVAYCASQGVLMAPSNGNGTQLVADIKAALDAGHPCLITEPDPYTANATHVCAAYKYGSNGITVADPWISQSVTKTDTIWAAQLQFNQIWTLEENIMPLSISQASGYFTASSDGSVWTCKSNNCILGHAMLAYYQQIGGGARAPLFGLTVLGLPLTNEQGPVNGKTGTTLQIFERGILCYDPSHAIDNPPQAGAVYQMHVDSGLGLAAMLALLKISPTPVVPVPDVASAITQINASIGSIQAAESTLQAVVQALLGK